MNLTQSEVDFIKINQYIIINIVEKRLKDLSEFIFYEEDENKMKDLKIEGRMLKNLLITINQITDKNTEIIGNNKKEKKFIGI